MIRKRTSLAGLSTSVFALLLGLALPAPVAGEEPQVPGHENPIPSIDYDRPGGRQTPSDQVTAMGPGISPPGPLTPISGTVIEAFDFDDNIPGTNFVFIPPDPIGAAGPDHLVNVGNVSIQWFTKAGTQQYLDRLINFFAPLNPVNFTFDPKVIYDQYAGRFVVITLERQLVAAGDPVNSSRILVAVSKTSDPNDGFWFQSINSLLTIGAFTSWADYPGLAIDDKAIYITNNMFDVTIGQYRGVRLWIVHKDWYNGPNNSGTVTLHDPYASAGTATTSMPSHMFGVPPGNAGTFLCSFSGLTDGSNEYIQFVRVDNPLTTPSFTQQYINLGDIDPNAGALVDAPQLGTTTRIEVNDRRALHAVWRDNQLYMVATYEPLSGPDAGEATAIWWIIDTNNLGALAVADWGDIGGEDIATDTWTFFPSIAVNGCGDVGIGFSASAATIYGSAAYTSRRASDPAGTVQNSVVYAPGTDYYIRTFGGPRNRWGDYSGMSVDPADDATFWAFNEYAITRGTPTSNPTEDGRWGQRWASFAFACVTLSASDTSLCEPDTLFIPVTIENCGDVTEDFDLLCMVGATTVLDTTITGVTAGNTAVVDVPVACEQPGQVILDCTVVAVDPNNPDCQDVDAISVAIDCLETCVTLAAGSVQTPLGTPVMLPVTVTNCGTDTIEVDVNCPVGNPTSINVPNLAPGNFTEVEFEIACTEVGNTAIACDAVATLLASPFCQGVDADTGQVQCNSNVTINEVRIDQPSTDNDEYFELAGPPGETLDGLTYLVVGDGTGGSGTIESVVSLGGNSIPAGGFFLAAEATFSLGPTPDLVTTLNFENSDNVTHFLVAGFTGSNGDDLDLDDDCVLDVMPWDFVVDRIALIEEENPPVGTECHYGPPTVGPDGSNVPGHAYVCSDLLDWRIGAFDPLLEEDTPRAANPVCPIQFLSMTRDPCIPGLGAADTILVVTTALSSSSAELTYDLLGTPTTVPMTKTSDVGGVQEYEGYIPPVFPAKSLVKYEVEIFNTNPDSATNSGHGYFVGTMNVADIRMNDPNVNNVFVGCDVRVMGATTVPFGVFSLTNTDWYLQDDTGGINVFQFGAHSVQPVEGDSVEVEGMITQFNGKLEITESTDCGGLSVVIGSGGPPVEPDSIDCHDIGEDLEGLLVGVRVLFDSLEVGTPFVGDTNYGFVQSSCTDFVVRVDADTDIPGATIQTRVADVYGIVSQFDSSDPRDSGYQIQPRRLADIQFISAPVAVNERPTGPHTALLMQNYPNPFRNSTEIRFTVPGGAESRAMVPVRLSLFDVQGRLVASLVDEPMEPGERSVILTSEVLREWGSGIYFYRLEVQGEVMTRKLMMISR